MDIKSLILIAGGVMIVAVVLHGIWIAWRSRRDNLRMEIVQDLIPEDFDENVRFRGELPNGGARVINPGDGPTLRDDNPPILMEATQGAPARAAVSQAVNQELFGNGESLITENRRPAHESRDSAHKPRTRAGGGYARTNGSHDVTRTDAPVNGVADKTTNGTGVQSPAAEPGVANQAANRNGSGAPLRPRVQNVAMPASPKAVVRRNLRERVESAAAMQTALPVKDAPVKDAQGREAQAQGREAQVKDAPADRDVVISIFMMARAGEMIQGQRLFDALRLKGIKYGDMNIFHRVDPVSRVALYSVANAVNPGTFDLARLNELRLPGVVFFEQLEGLDHPLEVFDDMRRVATDLGRMLDCELKDENRSVITAQTLDHYRERIAEYSRRRLSRRA